MCSRRSSSTRSRRRIRSSAARRRVGRVEDTGSSRATAAPAECFARLCHRAVARVAQRGECTRHDRRCAQSRLVPARNRNLDSTIVVDGNLHANLCEARGARSGLAAWEYCGRRSPAVPGWLTGTEVVSAWSLLGQDELAATRDLQQVTLGGVLDPEAVGSPEQLLRGHGALRCGGAAESGGVAVGGDTSIWLGRIRDLK